MSTFDEIKKIAKRMLEADKGLTTYRQAYERISNVQYTLPEPLRSWEWIRPIVSTAPHDALRAGALALSNLQEGVTVHPISVHIEEEDDSSAAAKERANEWEKALQWAVARAAKRSANFRHSVLWNALVYDEILAQLIHLPTQFRAQGLAATREDAALRYGDWAIQLVNPQEVHVEYSDYMPERVLRVTVKTAQEVVDFWGDAASKVRAKIKPKNEHAKEYYVEFDYVDYEKRAVWVAEANSWEQAVEDKGIVILEPEPWLTDLDDKPAPFLPWVAVYGGSIVSTNPIFSRRPMHFAVYQAEQWANANIFQTLFGSQAISDAMAPRDVLTGPGVEDVEIDKTTPAKRLELTSLQKYDRIQALGLQPSLTEAFDRINDAIRRSTVAEVLVTGQPMGGVEAFSAFNLQVQSAIASLGPWKNLGERFYEGLYELMLLIAHYRGEDVVGYGEGLDKYTIDSESIDPANIYISVELRPDVPVDRVQRVQAAIAMSQNLEYPTIKILEFLGETDPQGAMKDYWKEQLNRADMMGRLEKIRKTASGELEEMAAMMAQQMLQGMMQQQQAQQGPPGQGSPQQMMGPQGIEGVEGGAWNPAMGMPPPAMASPAGNTREAQTGLTRAGGPIAEIP